MFRVEDSRDIWVRAKKHSDCVLELLTGRLEALSLRNISEDEREAEMEELGEGEWTTGVFTAVVVSDKGEEGGVATDYLPNDNWALPGGVLTMRSEYGGI